MVTRCQHQPAPQAFDGRLNVTQHQQFAGQQTAQLGRLRLDPDGTAIEGDRLFVVAQTLMHIPEVLPRRQVLRAQFSSELKHFNRFGQTPCAFEQDAHQIDDDPVLLVLGKPWLIDLDRVGISSKL